MNGDIYAGKAMHRLRCIAGMPQIQAPNKLRQNSKKRASNKIHPNECFIIKMFATSKSSIKDKQMFNKTSTPFSVSSLSFTLVGPGSSAPFSHQTKHLCSRPSPSRHDASFTIWHQALWSQEEWEALWGSCGLTSQDTQPDWRELEEGLVTPEQPEHWLTASECELPWVLWKTRWHFLVTDTETWIVHSSFILFLSLGPDCLTH